MISSHTEAIGMVTIIKKMGENNNGYIDIEHRRAEALVYWQAFTNRPK
jgi:hypothetical protein